MKTGTTAGIRPTFAFYAETCFHRTEHFLHGQYQGLRGIDVRVIGRWVAHLDEFPAPDHYLVEEARTPAARIVNAIVRRACRDASSRHRLPEYAIRRIAHHLRRHPVDLVYCLFGWHATQVLDVLDLMDGRRPRIPLVFLAAGSDITSAPSLGADYLARLRRAIDRSALVLCGSEFLMRRLLDLGAPAEKLAVHYIGIRLPGPDRVGPADDPGDALRFLAVSRLSPVKGILRTIRAFAGAARQLPEATLQILGDGEQRAECEALVDRLGLRSRVTLRGSLPLAEVYAQMRRSHAFLQHNVTSDAGQEEGLGGSILEAMSHRLPVVVTRSGGVPEAVENGRTGLVVEPGDEPAMTRAMLDLAHDPVLRARLGAQGRRRAEGAFDLDRQNRRLESILHRAAEGTHR